jgi:hypothetical protein
MAGTSPAMTALIDSIIPRRRLTEITGQFFHGCGQGGAPNGMRLGCACVLPAKRPAAIFPSIFFPRKTIRAMVSFRTLSMVRRLLILGGQESGKWRPPSRSRRERLTAERSRPEMAPQRLEKIESAPGNGMGSEASNLQHLVRERVADPALRRIVSDRRLRPSGHSSRIRSAGRPMGNFSPRNPLKSLKTGKESRRRLRLSGHGLRIRRARRPREKSCRKRRLTL